MRISEQAKQENRARIQKKAGELFADKHSLHFVQVISGVRVDMGEAHVS